MELPDPIATLSGVLDDLVRRVDGISQAVVLSRDGLALAASQGMSREQGEHMAAVAAGLHSLARGAGQQFGGGAVRQTIIEMETALLFIAAAGKGSCLAVLCPVDANPGLIAYEMAMITKRIGRHLAANPRPAPMSAANSYAPGSYTANSPAANGSVAASGEGPL
jgi:predicted regulator of Ras-like GTPase activity (Roadblock/LC7/MglB family)